MGVVVGLFVFLMGITVIFGSWYTVDEGERGVLTRNGAITGVATPGLGFKLPLIDGIEKVTLRTQLAAFEKLAAYSKDQQSAELRVSVNYRILPDQVKAVYSTYGDAEALAQRLIYPRVYEELKTVFGQYTAVSAVQQREKLNLDVRTAIADAVKGPVIIEGVQIENIDFSDTYEANIEARMTAEVEVQKLHQQAEQAKVNAEITVTNAQAEADSRLAVAKAQADATILAGNAEATAIKARGDALKENPGLVSLTQAERWDGKLPVTMIPGGAVPFLNVN